MRSLPDHLPGATAAGADEVGAKILRQSPADAHGGAEGGVRRDVSDGETVAEDEIALPCGAVGRPEHGAVAAFP